MKIRLTGTSDECRAYVKELQQIYEIRTASEFYKNTRGPIDKEGRVYITVDGRKPEASERSGRKGKKEEPSKMKVARCIECDCKGRIAGIVWSGSGYVNYCVSCMKKFSDDQYVGMTVRHDDKDLYDKRIREKYGPHHIVAYMSGNQEITMLVPDTGDSDD